MKPIFLFSFLLFSIFSFSQKSTTDESLPPEDLEALYAKIIDSVEATLNWETEAVDIKDGLAKITIPSGFKYLNPEQSEMILTQIWGNPPSTGENKSLGMLFPKNTGLELTNSYAINITYSEDGYIDDSDAKDIDYDDLLKEMKEGENEMNKKREEMNYEPITIVGWASRPYYDSVNKKLYWAKELKFGDAPVNTLNYNIRILGRKGYLQLNAISDITTLPVVENDIDLILASVDFNSGNKYADFTPGIDKVAAIGIGGLIAGKVLAKAGFFVVLLKFWKIFAIGFVAFFGRIKNFFLGRKIKPAETSTEDEV